MHIFLEKFHQGGKYNAQISSHWEELRKEERITNHEYFSISSLQADYLNLYSSSGSGRNNERANIVKKTTLFVEVITIMRKNVLKR